MEETKKLSLPQDSPFASLLGPEEDGLPEGDLELGDEIYDGCPKYYHLPLMWINAKSSERKVFRFLTRFRKHFPFSHKATDGTVLWKQWEPRVALQRDQDPNSDVIHLTINYTYSARWEGSQNEITLKLYDCKHNLLYYTERVPYDTTKNCGYFVINETLQLKRDHYAYVNVINFTHDRGSEFTEC